MSDLIYGKNEISRVVSIEVEDDKLILFREDADTIELPNRYWILASKPLNKRFIRLKGDLHYKYGIQFSERSEFTKMRFVWKNEDIFSIYNPKEAAQVKDGLGYFKGLNPGDVSVLSFDIESTSLEHNEDAHVLIISNTFRKNGVVQRKLFCYDDYETEGHMIESWCEWVREIDPSVIIGHNIYCYDLPYLEYVAAQYNVRLNLGRYGQTLSFQQKQSKFRKDGSQSLMYNKPVIYGREIVDTMFLSYKYDVARNFPSYGLKPIIKYLDLEVEGREFYDATKIRDNYTIPEEWVKIKRYAEHDADDALSLYDLMIPPFFYMTQSIPKPFQMVIESASGSQINAIMMRAYLQDGHSLPKASDTYHFDGAISVGIPGQYSNVFKIDVKSLYPSIMIQYQVCDIDKDPNKYFLELVNTFTEKRLYHKSLSKTDKYHDDMQLSYKTLINSMYGFLGTAGLLFNSIKNAEFVTAKGREILQQTIEWATGKKYETWKNDNNL